MVYCFSNYYQLIESILKKYYNKILLEKTNTRLLNRVIEHQIGESGKPLSKGHPNDHVHCFISCLKDFFLEKHLWFILYSIFKVNSS